MKKLFFAAVVIFIASYAYASDIAVSVSEVRDSRTTGQFFAGLELKLKVMGDSLADARGLKINVKKAVDDTGRDLLKKDDDRRAEFVKPDENSAGQAEMEVKLKNPSRKASTIKELSGELTIYSPGKDPNSVATLDSFMGQAGLKIKNSALKAAKVEVGIMTKKQFDEFKEEQKKEAKAKEGAMVKEFGEAMAKAFGALFEGFMEIGENSVILNISDPDSKVVDLEFLDAAGASLRSGSSMRTGDIRVFEFEKPMPADARLKIFLATSKAMSKTSFKVSGIALP